MTAETAAALRPKVDDLKAQSEAIGAELRGARAQCGIVEQDVGAQLTAIRSRVDAAEHRMRSLNSSIMTLYDELDRIDPQPKPTTPAPANDQGRRPKGSK